MRLKYFTSVIMLLALLGCTDNSIDKGLTEHRSTKEPSNNSIVNHFSDPRLSSSLITKIGFESGTNYVSSGSNCNCDWIKNPYDGNVYRIVKEGPENKVTNWISLSMSSEGSRGFGVRLWDIESHESKTRVEFELSNGTNFPQHMQDFRFYGFSVFIHPQSDDIIKPTTFMQAWQNHDVSYSRYPPLSLQFKSGSDYKWSVLTSTGGSAPTDRPGNRSTIFTSKNGLEKGRWYRFVVGFKPSVDNSGAVKIWLDGTYQVGQTHQRNFGYPPVGEKGTPGAILDEFQVRVGAYRGRLPETNPPTYLGETIIVFDDLKLGMDYQAVY
ncbi:MAG: hypothetical protein FH748_07280 [Balneolaceae bacterium]|nr:hypothetical protein [Balneolaceae bacterium]